MDKKSTYGLKPEQLSRLLSIGSEGAKSGDKASEGKASGPVSIVPQIEVMRF